MTWRKSSYSQNTDAADCVEVVFDAEVGVRDSKNASPELGFSPEAWSRFVSRISAEPHG